VFLDYLFPNAEFNDRGVSSRLFWPLSSKPISMQKILGYSDGVSIGIFSLFVILALGLGYNILHKSP